jgi:hypothetical protein
MGIGIIAVLGIGTAFTVVGCSCSPAKEKKLSFDFMTGGEGQYNAVADYNSNGNTTDSFRILDENGTFLPLVDSSSDQEQNDAVKLSAQ